MADNQLGAARQLVEEGRSLNGREVKPSKRARKDGCHRAKTMEAHTHGAAQLHSFHLASISMARFMQGSISGDGRWQWLAALGHPSPYP